MTASDVVREFEEMVVDGDRRFRVRAVAAPYEGTTWQGWIEFIDTGGGSAHRTGRETVQPDRAAVAYWADGIETIYLDGAYERAVGGRQEPVA